MNVPLMKSKPREYKPADTVFGGLNLNEGAKEGEIAACKNMSSDNAPFLSPCKNKSVSYDLVSGTALTSYNGLVYVDDTTLYYNGGPVGTVTPTVKQFAQLNTKLIIWPDKKFLDLVTREFKSLDAFLVKSGENATFTTDTLQMSISTAAVSESPTLQYSTVPTVKVYTSLSWSTAVGWTKTPTGGTAKLVTELEAGDKLIPKKNAESGAYSVNSSTTGTYESDNPDGVYYEITEPPFNLPAGTYRWDKWTAEQREAWVGSQYITVWAPVSFVGYVYSTNPNLYPNPGYKDGWYYKERIYYGISASSALKYNIRYLSTASVLADVLKAGDRIKISGCVTELSNNSTDWVQVVSAIGSTVTVPNNTFTAATETGAVAIERSVPDLELICASDNRLWGVKGQTIYASALGDPTAFYTFDGVDTDSYQAVVDTPGDFTLVYPYNNTVLLHKEDMIYRVYGDYPSNYQYVKDDVPGCQKGCHKSAQVINAILYYKARDGVYAYSGGQPAFISYPLGSARYSNAVAGSSDRKYYISMEDQLGTVNMFVYDTLHRMWHVEDNIRALDFARYNGVLYYLDSATSYVMRVDVEAAEDIEWYAELVPFTEGTIHKKTYQRLVLRYDLDATAFLKVDVSFDGGPFAQALLTHDESLHTVIVPLPPNRCDTLKVKFSGEGGCIIRALGRVFSVRSDY